ncbi:MAG: TolC family protein [Verrucomicrobium sp.]|nr:TolC family protein [Verrucomicrobium sp.]
MKLYWIAGTVLVLTSWTARAEPPGAWTIDQLAARGMAANAELRSFEAEVAAAKGKRTQAGLWKNPEFTGEYGSRRVTGDGGNLAEGFTRSVTVTQTFEFPGKGSLRKAIADKDVELADLGLRQFRSSLAGQIRSLAYQYLAASAEADAAEEIRERSDGLVKLLGQRATAGVPQLLELRVIEAGLIDLRKSAREFAQSRDEAAIELNRLLGFPASQPVRIASVLAFPEAKVDADKWVLAGLAGNLQLRSRTAELEKAVRTVSAAKLDAAPDFSVGPFFSQDKAGDNEENLGVSLSMTLPLWNWNQGNVAAAKARRDQTDALLADARRKVEAEILRRIRSYQRTQAQLDGTTERTLADLREASDLADRQYRTGAIGVQLFLDSQRGFLAAQQTRQEAMVQAWRDLLDLELLTGGTMEAK